MIMLITKSKRVLVLALSLFAVVLIITSLVILVQNQDNSGQSNTEVSLLYGGEVSEKSTPCSTRDTESILSEAVSLFVQSAFDANDVGGIERQKKLFALEQDIISEEGYEKDANCLHILTMLFIDRSDALQAEKYLSLLEAGLEQSSPDGYILDENANFRTLDEMRSSIEAIKLNNQLRLENDPFKDQNRLNEKIDE
jgi:hypothetical protein